MSWYDTTQPDVEVPVMQELWGMWSTSSLPSLPGPLWPVVVVLDAVLSMDQIELNCVLKLNWIAWNRTVWHLNCELILNWIVWNGTAFACLSELSEKEMFWHLTVCKQKLYLY